MNKENIVLVSDPNLDPDDLISYLLISHYVKSGDIALKAIITTLGDKKTRVKRAKFAIGVFKSLDLDIPVAYGDDYTIENLDKAYNDLGYLEGNSVKAVEFEDLAVNPLIEANNLLYKTFNDAEDKSLSVVLNAGMYDISEFIKKHKSLFLQKIKKISVMGGIDFDKVKDGCFLPCYKSYNNATCYPAAINIFKTAQENNIPLYITPKETIYSVGLSARYYDEFETDNRLAGKFLFDVRKDALKSMWKAVKDGLYPHRDEKWFFDYFTFLDYENDRDKINKIREDFNLVWENGLKINLYDPIAVFSILDNINENSIICEKYKDKEIYISKVNNREILRKNIYKSTL